KMKEKAEKIMGALNKSLVFLVFDINFVLIFGKSRNEKMKLKALILLLTLCTSVYATDTATVINADGTVKIEPLSKEKERVMEALKNDIKFFHEKLGGIMAFIAKNKKEMIQKEKFSRRELAYIKHETGEQFTFVMNQTTEIQVAGEKISGIKFVFRKGSMRPQEDTNTVIKELFNPFSDDPKSIKMTVFHFPPAHKLANPIGTYGIDDVQNHLDKLELVRQYKENVRRTVRDLEQLIEHDFTQKGMVIWKSLNEFN
ncbi:MAG TPA: hypothetical protein PK683_11055, partial [Leptospiraceae bacterium]|nr:hypothetical protein [Leptospiraceae bacterium]